MLHTRFGVDFKADGSGANGSPSLDHFGMKLYEVGQQPTEYRMNGRMASDLAGALIPSTMIDDEKSRALAAAMRISHYIDKASGGVPVRVVVDPGLSDGEVLVESAARGPE